MEIKCANFKSVYTDIEKVVQNASFVALDVEFLGLDVEETKYKCSLFDFPEERYEKLRHSITRFAPVQLGLAFFAETSDPAKYNVYSYSIHLYRQGLQKQDFDFSVSSLLFLKSHGFDFNDFVAHGVSHLNLDELDDVMEKMVNFYDGLESFGPHMREAVNRVQQTLYHRLARYRRKSTGSEGASSRYFDPFFVNIDRENLSGLQKAVLLYKLYCVVPGVRMRIHENFIECDSSRLTKRELIQIKQGLLERIRGELMGVSEVVMAIIEKKLPLVGHNGLHDLMYLYHYFIANLPETYKQFKNAIRVVFPVYIDTKHLAEECTHKLSWFGVMSYRLENLGNFFNSTASEACVPKVDYKMMYPLRRKKNYHNAGFDATTTGKIFVRLAHLVARPMNSVDCGPRHYFRDLLDAVNSLANRVPVPLLGIPFLNLMGEDPPTRKPAEVSLTLNEDGSVQTLQQELKQKFGTWRCDIKVGKNYIRVASNTDTTARRVYNFLLSRSSYNVLQLDSFPYSSNISPYRSPSPRQIYSSNESLASSAPSISIESDFGMDSVFNWVHTIGFLIFNLHIDGRKTLF